MTPEQIVAVRRSYGDTQVAFAVRLGINVENVRNWEQGKRTPRGPAVALLRRAEVDLSAQASERDRAMVGRDDR